MEIALWKPAKGSIDRLAIAPYQANDRWMRTLSCLGIPRKLLSQCQRGVFSHKPSATSVFWLYMTVSRFKVLVCFPTGKKCRLASAKPPTAATGITKHFASVPCRSISNDGILARLEYDPVLFAAVKGDNPIFGFDFFKVWPKPRLPIKGTWFGWSYLCKRVITVLLIQRPA